MDSSPSYTTGSSAISSIFEKAKEVLSGGTDTTTTSSSATDTSASSSNVASTSSSNAPAPRKEDFGALENDAEIGGTKIEPLASEIKEGESVTEAAGGVVGSDEVIDEARIAPLGGAGQYQNPAAEADDGVIGKDITIQSTKIEPLAGPLAAEPGSKGSDGTYKGDVGDTTGTSVEGNTQGLDDQVVDGARIAPMGEVREEMKPNHNIT